MQFLTRGNDVLLLTDKNEVINLEKAVNLNAMALLEDLICYEQGTKNSNGKEVSKSDLRLRIEISSALSNALMAVKS